MAKPVRRGRPPRTTAAPAESRAVAHSGAEQSDNNAKPAVAPSVRRPRGSVGGHGQKLGAPAKPGFVRRFVNDVGNRVAQLRDLGYTVADEPGVQTSDPGSVISRLAGTQEGGAPLKAILMETPNELYQQGRSEMEEDNSRTDAAILGGRDGQGGLTERETYRPAGHQNSIEIER